MIGIAGSIRVVVVGSSFTADEMWNFANARVYLLVAQRGGGRCKSMPRTIDTDLESVTMITRSMD